MKPPEHKRPPVTPQRLADLATAVRGLCAACHAALVYPPTHAVLRKIADQQVARFDEALRGLDSVTVTVARDRFHYDWFALEPGSVLLQKTARMFEQRGIRGLMFLPGVTAGDILGFVSVLILRAPDVAARGLADCLARQGVRHIAEHRPAPDVRPAAPKAGERPRGKAKTAGAKRPVKGRKGSRGSSGPAVPS